VRAEYLIDAVGLNKTTGRPFSENEVIQEVEDTDRWKRLAKAVEGARMMKILGKMGVFVGVAEPLSIRGVAGPVPVALASCKPTWGVLSTGVPLRIARSQP
jgi:hypothetical protein